MMSTHGERAAALAATTALKAWEALTVRSMEKPNGHAALGGQQADHSRWLVGGVVEVDEETPRRKRGGSPPVPDGGPALRHGRIRARSK